MGLLSSHLDVLLLLHSHPSFSCCPRTMLLKGEMSHPFRLLSGLGCELLLSFYNHVSYRCFIPIHHFSLVVQYITQRGPLVSVVLYIKPVSVSLDSSHQTINYLLARALFVLCSADTGSGCSHPLFWPCACWMGWRTKKQRISHNL